MGGRGILVIKDVTSILSMNRETRQQILAALREVHDGHWSRRIGGDGGRKLTWTGRLVVVGAVTTSWDTHHGVVSALGDRFLLFRMNSRDGRTAAGRQALRNTGQEAVMRKELGDVAVRLLAGRVEPQLLSEADLDMLLRVANTVTLCRSAVEFDYRGDLIEVHMPEAPTRCAKQLHQLVLGARALGMTSEASMRLAVRVGHDSMPPMRLAILEAVSRQKAVDRKTPAWLTQADIVRLLPDRPRTSVERQVDALHGLGVLAMTEEEGCRRFRLAAGIDLASIDDQKSQSTRYLGNQRDGEGDERARDRADSTCSDFSGHAEGTDGLPF
jgi:hypothetical protein